MVSLAGYGITWAPRSPWKLSRFEGTDRILSVPDPDAADLRSLVIEPGQVDASEELIVAEAGPPELRYVTYRRGATGTMIALPPELGRDLARYGDLGVGSFEPSWTLRANTFRVPFIHGFEA